MSRILSNIVLSEVVCSKSSQRLQLAVGILAVVKLFRIGIDRFGGRVGEASDFCVMMAQYCSQRPVVKTA